MSLLEKALRRLDPFELGLIMGAPYDEVAATVTKLLNENDYDFNSRAWLPSSLPF